MENKLIIIGAGGHAGVVIDAAERQGFYNIYGLLDDTKAVDSYVHGYRILGGIPKLFELSQYERDKRDKYTYFIAIGDNYSRFKLYMRFHELKLKYATIIHPSAKIGSRVYLDAGVVVMAGATVNTGSKIEKQVILNTQSSVDHDTLIEEFASMAPASATGGNVIVGRGTAICMGAMILNGVIVGSNSVIGAGSIVTVDQPDNVVAYGTPCNEVRKHDNENGYL